MWFGVFALPLFLAWVVIAIAAILISALVENENGTAATVTLIIVLALLHAGKILNIVALLHSPSTWILYFLVYLVCGAPWAVVKWGFFLKRWKESGLEAMQNCRENFFKSQSLPYSETIPDELKEGWARAIATDYEAKSYMTPLQIRHYVGRLVAWATYWPFSIVYTILDDPLKRFFQYLVYGVLGKYLQERANARAAEVALAAGVTATDVAAHSGIRQR